MPRTSQDFALGFDLGEKLYGSYQQGQLRRGLGKLDAQQIEEIRTEQAADPKTQQSQMLAEQNAGLEAPLPPTPKVTGYKYGDQTFKYKPPQELIDATKADQRAGLYEQHGDIDKAQVLRESAVKQRALAIQAVMDRGVRSGSLRGMVNAYSLIDDGVDADFEVGDNGQVTVFAWDQGNPESRSPVFTAANEQEAMKRVTGMIDPDMAMKLAEHESVLEQRRWSQMHGDRTFGALADERGFNRAQSTLDFAQKHGTPGLIEHGLRKVSPYYGLDQELPAAKVNEQVRSFTPQITQAAQQEGVPAGLVSAMMQAESAGNPNAVSPAGAQGLMQIMPATGGDLGLRDPFNPEQNIRAGAKYLGQLLQRYDGNTGLAVAAYNMGPGALDAYLAGKRNMPGETQAYVQKVMRHYGGLDMRGTANQMYEERQARSLRRGSGGSGQQGLYAKEKYSDFQTKAEELAATLYPDDVNMQQAKAPVILKQLLAGYEAAMAASGGTGDDTAAGVYDALEQMLIEQYGER